MSALTVTTEQVHELIEQLAAMTAAASITPQMVANIFENMRQLNDQERAKVIATAEAYIAEIQNTGISVKKVLLDDGGSSGATIDDILTEEFNDGFFYNFGNLSVNSIAPQSPIANANWTCCLIPVKAGETYNVICTGGSSGRAYALTDNNRVILSIAESDLKVNSIISVQQDGYLYINSIINDSHFVSLYNISHVLSELLDKLSDILSTETQLVGTFIAHGTIDRNNGSIVLMSNEGYNVNKYQCVFGKQYRIVTGRGSSDSSGRAYAYAYASNNTPISLIRDTTNVDDEFIYKPTEEVSYIQVYSGSGKQQYVYESDIAITDKINTLENEVNSLSSGYISIISVLNIAKSLLIPDYFYSYANLSVGDTAPSTPVASSNWTCCKIPVKAGDKILLNIQGGGNARAYALTDSDNKILTLADANATISETLTVSQNGYLYVNNSITYSAIIILSSIFDSMPNLINQVSSILSRLTIVENDTSNVVTYTSEDLYVDSDNYKSYFYVIAWNGAIQDPISTSPQKFTGSNPETVWGCLPIIELNPGATIEIRTKGGGNGRAYAITDMSNHPLIVADADIDTRSNPFIYTTETKCKLWVNTHPNNDENFSVIIRQSIKGAINGLQADVDILKESISNIVSDASAISNQPIDIRKDSKPTLRVLDIGNSFTMDPTDMLPGLVNSSNLDISDMCLYRMVRSSGSWKTFYDSWHNNDGEAGCQYSTSKLLGGQTQSISGSTNYDKMQSAIKDCQWDLIIIHQVSTYSAAYELWDGNTAAGYFLEFLRILRTYQPQASIGFLMAHCSYNQSGGDTATLFAKAVRSTKQAVSRCNINFVIPVAAAIENLRASAAMADLYPNVDYGYSRDAHHLGYGLARYTAACAYFQCVFGKRYGKTVFGNTYRYIVSEAEKAGSTYPNDDVDVTNDNAPTAQVCAMLAYEDMYAIHNPDGILSTLYIYSPS